MVLICPITDDTNFNHFTWDVSAKLFHCRITVFLFGINKYPVKSYFETWYISCYSSNFHCIFSTYWGFLPESVITMMVGKWWFSNTITLSAFINWISSIRNKFPFYPFIYYWSLNLWIFFYSVGCKSLLSLFILFLKLSQIRPMGTPSSWLLCCFDIHSSFFGYLFLGTSIKPCFILILCFPNPSYRSSPCGTK